MNPVSQDILLVTLNARYIHSSLGLRYLFANMGELQERTEVIEYTINQRAVDIAEDLLRRQARIIGFGVYIWNREETRAVVEVLKTVAPQLVVVLGGPELSYEYDDQEIVSLADHLITGQADLAFAELCATLLLDQPGAAKIAASVPHPRDLALPYRYYSQEDVAHRVIYVEASRGCPYKCEFCLSALDKTAVPFPLDTFLREMQSLYERGARHFKFVDRTFNLKISTSVQIMEFFLDKHDPELFLHFELIPDHLPERLKEVIARFAPGQLQFEVGIQTFNERTQSLISRKQNNVRAEENLRWLRNHTHAHIHVDLIVGLPAEDMDSFGRGLNRLIGLDPHEIQIGMLKRLRGTPIIRHSTSYDMRYMPRPPYTILSNRNIEFSAMQRLARLARYWDLVINSGRFVHTRALLLGGDAFSNMLDFSDWLFAQSGQTHRFALARLFDYLHRYLLEEREIPQQSLLSSLQADYARAGLKGVPSFLRTATHVEGQRGQRVAQRQKRHRS